MTAKTKRTAIWITALILAAITIIGITAYYLSRPSTSSDKRTIVFVSRRDFPADSVKNESAIYGMNMDGTGQERLTDNAAPCVSPAWSPDGNNIVYVMNEDIYVIKRDGFERLKLATRGSFPQWSPDGKQILFTRQSISNNYEMGVMDADGNNSRLLVQGHVTQFQWSPDGKTIAYVQGRSGPNSDALIHILDPKSKADTILPAPTGGDANSPDWSPDGTKIVFSSFAGNERGDIYIIDVATKDLQKLKMPNDMPIWRYLPVWSPNGRQIAFLTKADQPWVWKTAPANIAVINADGTSAKILSRFKNRQFASDMTWTDNKLLFTFNSIKQKNKKDVGSADICVMGMDGVVKQLTKTGRDYSPGYSALPR